MNRGWGFKPPTHPHPANSNSGRHLTHRPHTPVSIAPLCSGPCPHVAPSQLQIPGAAHARFR